MAATAVRVSRVPPSRRARCLTSTPRGRWVAEREPGLIRHEAMDGQRMLGLHAWPPVPRTSTKASDGSRRSPRDMHPRADCREMDVQVAVGHTPVAPVMTTSAATSPHSGVLHACDDHPQATTDGDEAGRASGSASPKPISSVGHGSLSAPPRAHFLRQKPQIRMHSPASPTVLRSAPSGRCASRSSIDNPSPIRMMPIPQMRGE